MGKPYSGLTAKSAITINPDICRMRSVDETTTQTKEMVTFGLDLLSLVECKIALEEIWLVEIGSHCRQLIADCEMRWAWEWGKILEATYAQIDGGFIRRGAAEIRIHIGTFDI